MLSKLYIFKASIYKECHFTILHNKQALTEHYCTILHKNLTQFNSIQFNSIEEEKKLAFTFFCLFLAFDHFVQQEAFRKY